VLAEPGSESAVCAAILSALLDDQSWTILELTDLSPDSLCLGALDLRQSATTHDITSVLSLPSHCQELGEQFSPRQRANLRNARSRLHKAGGGWIEAASAETLPEFLDDLFRLHTLRWSERGEPGVLDDNRLRAFHQIAAPRLLACGMLRAYRLRVAAGTAAVLYALLDHHTVYCYLQGFHPEFRFFSPGTLLMFSAIEDAVACGMRRFDFLRGQESYKQHWRAQSQFTYRIAIGRRDALSRLKTSPAA